MFTTYHSSQINNIVKCAMLKRLFHPSLCLHLEPGYESGIPTWTIFHHNFFLLEIIILRLHNINPDTTICVVCEYHKFLNLINEGISKVKSHLLTKLHLSSPVDPTTAPLAPFRLLAGDTSHSQSSASRQAGVSDWVTDPGGRGDGRSLHPTRADLSKERNRTGRVETWVNGRNSAPNIWGVSHLHISTSKNSHEPNCLKNRQLVLFIPMGKHGRLVNVCSRALLGYRQRWVGICQFLVLYFWGSSKLLLKLFSTSNHTRSDKHALSSNLVHKTVILTAEVLPSHALGYRIFATFFTLAYGRFYCRVFGMAFIEVWLYNMFSPVFYLGWKYLLNPIYSHMSTTYLLHSRATRDSVTLTIYLVFFFGWKYFLCFIVLFQ